MKLRGVVPISQVAKKWGVTQRCAKRRLKKYDARLAGQKMLVQLAGPKSEWCADVAMLKRYLPGLVADDDEDDPFIKIQKSIDELKEIVIRGADAAEAARDLSEILEDALISAAS